MTTTNSPRWLSALLLTVLMIGPAAAFAASSTGAPARPTAPRATFTRQQAAAQLNRLPLRFESLSNDPDTTSDSARFLSRGSGFSVLLTPTAALLALGNGAAPGHPAGSHHRAAAKAGSDMVRMELQSANPHPRMEGLEESPGRTNYLISSDPTKWRTGIRTYDKVRYSSIYPKIDLVYYGNGRRLEHDFIVRPGGDPGAITLGFGTEPSAGAGAQAIRPRLTRSGALDVRTRSGRMTLEAPTVYQEVAGVRRPVPGRYVSRGPGSYGFRVGAYDHRRALIIDPVLFYTTYLGGTGDDEGQAIAVDSAGNVYVTGHTTSTDFPTSNALIPKLGGTQDAFVVKLDPAGTGVLYSTYLGGSGIDDGRGIAIDAGGNAFVTGSTQSVDFPILRPLTGQGILRGGQDAFVTRISADGSKILFSTFLGGSNADAGNGIALDTGGSVYLVGNTSSMDFPNLNAFRAFNGGGQDAFVAKISFNPNTGRAALVYGSYLGGSGLDGGNGIAVDGMGNAYITGFAQSVDFPVANPLIAKRQGLQDAFVAKIAAADGVTSVPFLVYSTFLGGQGFGSSSVPFSEGRAIAVDPGGTATVVGWTSTPDFPTTPGSFEPFTPDAAGNDDGFIIRIAPDGASVPYSSFIGGTMKDKASGVAVDRAGNAYVTGYTLSPNAEFAGLFQKAAQITGASGGGMGDAFVMKISPNGSSVLYFTLLGGSGQELDGDVGIPGIQAGNNIALGRGAAFVTGTTTSTDFPPGVTMLQGKYQGGAADAFVAEILEEPAPPTNLVAVGFTPTQINLTWTDNSSNESGFTIERSSGGGAFMPIATTPPNTTFYADMGLMVNTTYSYRVRATNSAGASAYSNVATATTLTAPPNIPVNLAAIAVSPTQVNLTWTDNFQDETGFILQRQGGSGGVQIVIPDTDPKNPVRSYADTSVLPNTMYTYTIMAVNQGSVSAASAPAVVTTPDLPPAAPIDLLVAPISTTSINLSWTDESTNETGFEVWRETHTGKPTDAFVLIATLPANTTTFTDTGLMPNTTYTYEVRAINATGPSSFTNMATTSTQLSPPTAPTNIVAKAVSDAEIDLLFTYTAGNAQGFRVERMTGTGAFTAIATLGPDARGYADTSVLPNTTYTYRVITIAIGGESPPSDTATATTPTAPAAPVSLAAIASSPTQINLSWVDNAGDQTGFKIQRMTGNGMFTQIATVGAGVRSFSDITAMPGVSYTYRVLATNANGASSPSNTASATTLPNAPGAPTNVMAAPVSASQITVSWTYNNNDQTGFKIERKIGSGAYMQIAVVGPNIKSFTDSGLSSNTIYTYRVRSTNAGGDSPYSNEASAGTATNRLTGTVTVTSAGSATPVSGLAVQLLDSTGTNSVANAVTDSSGGYAFLGLVNGSYTVKISPPGQAAQSATVTVNASQNNGATVQNFTIAALANFSQGLSLVSVPYDYSGTGVDAAAIFGLPIAADGSAPIAGYDPIAGQYGVYPNLPGSGKFTVPGRGYWIKEATTQPFAAIGKPVSSPFTITLNPGWNLIGDPFTTSVSWSTVQVQVSFPVGSTAAGTFINLQTAVSNRLLNGTLYGYSVGQQAYFSATSLDPFNGYWVFIDPQGSVGQTNRQVTLQFTAAQGR